MSINTCIYVDCRCGQHQNSKLGLRSAVRLQAKVRECWLGLQPKLNAGLFVTHSSARKAYVACDVISTQQVYLLHEMDSKWAYVSDGERCGGQSWRWEVHKVTAKQCVAKKRKGIIQTTVTETGRRLPKKRHESQQTAHLQRKKTDTANAVQNTTLQLPLSD